MYSLQYTNSNICLKSVVVVDGVDGQDGQGICIQVLHSLDHD